MYDYSLKKISLLSRSCFINILLSQVTKKSVIFLDLRYRRLWNKNLTYCNHTTLINNYHYHRLFSTTNNSIATRMEDIKDITIGPMPDKSAFLKPLRMEFKQNGRQRYWDMVKAHESVTCVLYNVSRNVLIFVKQFRPAVFVCGALPTSPSNSQSVQDVDWNSVPPKIGITIELCAGIIDADLSLNEIIQKEVLEECGYDVPLQNFQRIIGYKGSVGVSGDKSTMFYAECTDEMHVSQGGGKPEEGEFIEVVEMSIPEVRQYLQRETVASPGALLFGLMWFLINKAPKGC
ncbi:unnamed protein product [Orchesella dallaii]|uniref:Uridine diphosphate glucose pyrophosphatase n=1 Tax=Orchesella dallaii TaxID=48710 RepID=A0ABP1PX04_9HEXA